MTRPRRRELASEQRIFPPPHSLPKTRRPNPPRLRPRPDKVLVESGEDLRLITSGSHATWYDLLLYVISRTGGSQAALQTAKFFLLQWHTDGQSPSWRSGKICCTAMRPSGGPRIGCRPTTASPAQSPPSRRSPDCRHAASSGVSSRRLEESELSLEAISWRVGYEDVAFFNRLFKRTTGLTPREYRQKFSMPSAYRGP